MAVGPSHWGYGTLDHEPRGPQSGGGEEEEEREGITGQCITVCMSVHYRGRDKSFFFPQRILCLSLNSEFNVLSSFLSYGHVTSA